MEVLLQKVIKNKEEGIGELKAQKYNDIIKSI